VFQDLFEAKFKIESNILKAQDKLRSIAERKIAMKEANLKIQANKDAG
jgi:hypothetical protein